MVSEIVYSKTVKMLSKDMDNFIQLLSMNEVEASLSNEKTNKYKILIIKDPQE